MNIREYTKYKEQRVAKRIEMPFRGLKNTEDNQDLHREYLRKLRRHRTNVVLVVGFVVTICLASVGGWRVYDRNVSYTGYEIINSIERADADTAKYVPYNGGMLKYSNDGAAFIGAD